MSRLPTAVLRCWLAAALLAPVATAQGGWSSELPTDDQLSINGFVFDPVVGPPPLPATLMAPAHSQLFIVQLRDDDFAHHRAALEAMGARVTYYVPSRAYLVRMPRTLADTVAEQPWVRSVTDFAVAYRLEPSVVSDMIGHTGFATKGRYDILVVEQGVDGPRLERSIEELGGRLHRRAEGGILIEATLTAEQLEAVARLNSVLWIDRWSEPELDVDPRIQMGVTYVEAVAGLRGQGVRGHLFEGVDPNHPEFAAIPPWRTTPIPLLNPTPTEHGTRTAGLIFARGLQVTGVLPLGQMIYTHYAGVNRFTLIQELVDPSKSYQAMFHTASWGSARTPSYTSVSADLDNALFLADLFTTNSHGNTGTVMSRPEAWAKNCAGVAGFMHFNNYNPADDCWCGGSSTGPAADGRVGVSFTSYHDGLLTTSGSNAYAAFSGTSAATPVVAGAAGLAMQIFGDGYLGYPAVPWQSRFAAKPHLTTTRVLLAVSSRQLAFHLANRYQQGWGFPNLQDLYDLRDNILVLDEEDVLRQGQSRTYLVWVKPGTPELRASMHHLEPEAAPFAQPTRINSLDLEVVTPSGAVYWGNDPGLLTSPFSSPGGSPNDVDVHENVILPRPGAGVYQVTVRATAVRQDSHLETPELDADFALAVRGIGGGRDRSGMLLDLISDSSGQLDVSLTSLPAGWVTGYTLLSAETSRHPSLGNVFGLEGDLLTLSVLGQTPAPGNVFAFAATSDPTLYPNATFRFPAPVVAALQGLTLDGVAFTIDATGGIGAVSNVDRVTIQ